MRISFRAMQLIGFALVLYLLLNIGFTTFDAYTHLYFSKHYRESWFSTMDYHTGGGIDLSTYPPLTYHLITLLSYTTSIEIASAIVVILSYLAIASFVTEFVHGYTKTKSPIKWLTFGFVFFSAGLMNTVFVFGQLTTLVGLAFGFGAIMWLNRYLTEEEDKERRTKHLILFSLSLVLCSYSHNVSFMMIGLFVFMIGLMNLKRVISRWKTLLPTGLLILVMVMPIYYPLFSKTLGSQLVPKEEIPHWSRTPLSNSLNIERWLSMYSITLFMLVLPIVLYLTDADVLDRKSCFKLYLIAVMFLVFGLGRETPLTRAFGPLEHWLTFERFSLVASIMFSALMSLFVPNVSSLSIKIGNTSLNLLLIAFLTLFAFFSVDNLVSSHIMFFSEPVGNPMRDRATITDFTLQYMRQLVPKYRYQTFGYGRPIAELYYQAPLPTLDTDYFTGRQIDWIRESGTDEIDQTRNKEFFQEFLDRSYEHSVKYIFTYDDYYHKLIPEPEWQNVWTETFEGTTVKVWTSQKDVPYIEVPEEKMTLFHLIWGLLPVAVLTVFIIYFFKHQS